MGGENEIKERTSKLETALHSQVGLRTEAIKTQCTAMVTALEAEKDRTIQLATAQANAQFKQQKQALEMQKDQQTNALAAQEQQQRFGLQQQAAAAQQQRAQMELARDMQKAMYGHHK